MKTALRPLNQQIYTHSSEILVQPDTPCCKIQRNYIFLIRYELTDSESANVRLSMTKVSADQRPRKDQWDATCAVNKALPIQNLVMVWWQRLELQRRGLCKCLLIKWAEDAPESDTLKCFGRWGILPVQQQSLIVVVVVSVCQIASGLGVPGCIVWGGGHRGARRWRPADGAPDTIQRKHRTGSRRVKEKEINFPCMLPCTVISSGQTHILVFKFIQKSTCKLMFMSYIIKEFKKKEKKKSII